jgi:hypothetical protein
VKGSKVDMKPGLPTTPRVMLEKMVERTAEIQNLIIIEQDKEGIVHVWQTQMSLGDEAWMQKEFERMSR